MIKEIYRLRLVIILAIIAVFMGMVRFRYRNYDWSQLQATVQITPTPTATQSGGQATPTTTPVIEEVYPLIDSLPYKGKDFTVDSYSAPYTLNIITSGNIKTVTKEVYKWMVENKVATESHKLIFSNK